MLRIALDTTPILPKPSGIGFYVVKLLEELTQIALTESLQLEPFYQISLKSAIRGNFSAPLPSACQADQPVYSLSQTLPANF
jgi:hypothetical protein